MSVLKSPLVTEKVTSENDKGKFGFLVNVTANKVEIKKEVEKLYGVKVKSVNTIRYQGKKVNRMTKTAMISGRKSAFKKAIVTLLSGEVIDFYNNI